MLFSGICMTGVALICVAAGVADFALLPGGIALILFLEAAFGGDK
jgi:hypothetical protein